MAEVASKAPADERLVTVGWLARVLTRPDIGAFLGAVAVWLAFGYFARDVHWLSDPAIAAGWTDQAAQYGIVAVPVALLMIGGEFDLSAGVMIGSSGLLLGYLTTFQDMNVWPAMALVLIFGLAIGFINGVTVIKTKLPSFIVTLATFFILQGVNAAGTLKLTGQTAIQNIDSASGFNTAHKIFAGDLPTTPSRSRCSGGSASRSSAPGCSQSRVSGTGSTARAASRTRPGTSASPSRAPRFCFSC